MIGEVLGNIDIHDAEAAKEESDVKERHNSEKRGEVKVAMEDIKVKVKDKNQNETKADEMVPDWLWGGCNHKYDHAGFPPKINTLPRRLISCRHIHPPIILKGIFINCVIDDL